MLLNNISPQINNVVLLYTLEFHLKVTFQQDDVPSYHYRYVRDYLDSTYRGRWIGVAKLDHPMSRLLTSFFGFKSNVYKINPMLYEWTAYMHY